MRQSRRSVRRSRADGSAEGGRSSTAERKGSILRRRKTSTGRRLGSTVRMGGAGAADVSLFSSLVNDENRKDCCIKINFPDWVLSETVINLLILVCLVLHK